MPDTLLSAANHTTARNVDQSSFVKEVIEASKTAPVLVEFHSPGSASCEKLAPALEKAVRATEGRVKLTRLDVEANRALAAQLAQMGLPLHSVPLVVAFWQGQVCDLFQGEQTDGKIRSFLEKLLKESGQAMPVTELLKNADAALKDGELAEATNGYASVLEAEPENPAGWGGLIRCMISMDDPEGAEEAASQVPQTIAGSEPVANARAALALYQEGREAAGRIGEIRSKLEQVPGDTALLEELAKALNGAGQRDEAAGILLGIIARDQDGAGQAAKAELLKLFDAWGMTDPATLAARRKLSSLLFS